MSVQHQDFVEDAIEMIAEDGRPMMLVRQQTTGPAYDPQILPAKIPIIGLQTNFTAMEKSGGLVQDGDIKVLTDATVKPDVSMRLLDNGVPYSIVDIDTVKPGGTPIMYRIHARN